MVTPIAIGIHGGCGTLDPSLMPESEWADARAQLAGALHAGWQCLSRGASAVDAVEAAILVLEDSPHFNAGYGAALNADGVHELDASIMDGATLGAGAVAGIRRVKNPIRAARAVMDHSQSVLLIADEADAFAQRQDLVMVDNSHFTTVRRTEALGSLKKRIADGTLAHASEAEKHGTVGAVALDRRGHLAAGTSTGGFTNKPPGRVGDSPIIGAGTYARDGVCAVSGTGQGEHFIRHAAAYDIAARMMYAGEDLKTATDRLISGIMSSDSVGAGVVAVDAKGQVLAPYNTLGMFRGWIMQDGRVIVATHAEEHVMGQVARC